MWELKYSFHDPVGTIRITEDWSGDGNGIAGLQWLGGVVLSRYMDSREVFPEDHFVGRRVIEVGAGCGLTSIYAALRGAEVTITDMDIGKCLDNVQTNLGPRGLADKVCVRRLEWASAADLALCSPPYDVVIAGDCLYEEACIAPLLKTMWELAGPETEVLLCGVVGNEILQSFLDQVDTYFYRETVDTSTIDTLATADPPGMDGASSAQKCMAKANSKAESRSLQVSGEPTAAVGERQSVGLPAAERPGQRALLRLRKKQHTQDGPTTPIGKSSLTERIGSNGRDVRVGEVAPEPALAP